MMGMFAPSRPDDDDEEEEAATAYNKAENSNAI
jgi:hypothetical protein